MFLLVSAVLALQRKGGDMFDLLFVGNPAVNEAIAEPEDMPQSLIARLRRATLKTLEKTYDLAIESRLKRLFFVDQS